MRTIRRCSTTWSGAYEHWIDQGADALPHRHHRWMPPLRSGSIHRRIRAKHPGLLHVRRSLRLRRGEDRDASPCPSNGGISVLDFPMKQAMDEVFGRKGAPDFERLAPSLYLQDGPYANPYDLATFYDNHDMPRMDASDEGFIDAHNWLFTARGIPVVYYGSEMGFMRGRAEHAGNRNYFGQEGIAAARRSPIHAALARIANVRAATPALQRGVQVEHRAAGRSRGVLSRATSTTSGRPHWCCSTRAMPRSASTSQFAAAARTMALRASTAARSMSVRAARWRPTCGAWRAGVRAGCGASRCLRCRPRWTAR
jgi:hypothetical protein